MLKDKIMKKNQFKKLAKLKKKTLTIIRTWIKFDKEKKHNKDGIVKKKKIPSKTNSNKKTGIKF
jgi:hypothetical protein